jgi:DnaJ-class molecular chaperone
MPVYEFNSSYGNLIVTFNVHIPSQMTEKQKDAIRLAFNIPKS